MKRRIIIQLIFIVLLGCGVLTSCTWEEIKPQKVTVPETVKFSTNIIPVLTLNCAKSGCHVKGYQAPDLSAANAYTSLIYYGYVDTDYPNQSSLYVKIT